MKKFLAQLLSGQKLSANQTQQAFELLMTGQASTPQIASLLTFLAQRGPTIDEIHGAARVMRSKVAPVSVPDNLTVIDTCGTGGTGSKTFNISTSAAIVAAAAGRPHNIAVAKHGNKSVTSNTGSSQVLESLGVKLNVKTQTLTKCLDLAGICFCFAPAHHPAMKFAAPVRAELGFRTIFNLLGPLTNPAGATRQVLGVYDPKLTEPIASVLQRLGAQRAMVVHATLNDGAPLGELVTCGITRISQLCDGQIKTYDLDPDTLGFKQPNPTELYVESPQQSASIIRDVLAGNPSPARDIVILNAAAALLVAGLADDLKNALPLAAAAIDSGDAQKTLEKLAQTTQADPSSD